MYVHKGPLLCVYSALRKTQQENNGGQLKKAAFFPRPIVPEILRRRMAAFSLFCGARAAIWASTLGRSICPMSFGRRAEGENFRFQESHHRRGYY